MFSKANKNNSPKSSSVSTPKKRVAPSIISEDLSVTGNLSSEGEIQIDGRVTGDIQSKDILVGETAHIKGEIIAESIRVHGKVDGQIKAQNVSLAKSSHVVGDILHDNLSIETGAFLEGHCKRLAEGEFSLESDKKPLQEKPTSTTKSQASRNTQNTNKSASNEKKATA
ncbi:Integral membrane protein CcmA involved in cell shape determination (modular protein) [Candidatus Terasakiella magnetica]|uniref:Integral membrane protein CcmA involved in cell shape determination (Modular protein) n=1 Tax=Candidatus Terasakiella magnetica TaxID=1867952 RepID=A0A1C3RCR8_9PROT|nr:polymer-forming cytoskeletal protein [Candidatus Terasakiella magnetica]SCA55073.1 Integral membrane protein CcmA involved in cell shape determination (modular protein) [Candidatus Terasakiella magnetica]